MFRQVIRPSNGLVLAKFSMWHNYRYRFADGGELPMETNVAWCTRCQDFVESEQFYPEVEIEKEIRELNARRTRWLERVGEENARHRNVSWEAWESAPVWGRNRKSPPRCLKCGSSFGITVLPYEIEVRHPAASGTIMLTTDVTFGGVPVDHPPIYFDGEGRRAPV